MPREIRCSFELGKMLRNYHKTEEGVNIGVILSDQILVENYVKRDEISASTMFATYFTIMFITYFTIVFKIAFEVCSELVNIIY